MRLKAETVIRITVSPRWKSPNVSRFQGPEFFEKFSIQARRALAVCTFWNYAEGFGPQSRATASEPAGQLTLRGPLGPGLRDPAAPVLGSLDERRFFFGVRCRRTPGSIVRLAWARVSPRLDASW